MVLYMSRPPCANIAERCLSVARVCLSLMWFSCGTERDAEGWSGVTYRDLHLPVESFQTDMNKNRSCCYFWPPT